MGIIAGAIGVSSNGRTRDFGSLYHGSNPCAPTKIKQCPQRAFFILLYVTDCTISFSDCTAKHYQCFVRVSENQRFPKTLVGNIPTPLCAPQPHFASATLRVAGHTEEGSYREVVSTVALA